jgi:hypothetical protein
MIAVQRCGTLVNRRRSKPRLRVVVALACGVIASGCGGPKPLYGWSRYEESLYASYVAHDDAKAWSALEATVTSAQETGNRIPPGACAEYGFSLYRRGQPERAVQYFQQEAQLFPESKPLMDKLIAKVRERAVRDAEPQARTGAAP